MSNCNGQPTYLKEAMKSSQLEFYASFIKFYAPNIVFPCVVVSNCEFVTFPLVSLVRCGT